jgi:ParB-like chromosome segregation protein Spo0J
MEQRQIDFATVDINSIKAHPKNVRQGDIGAISESLKAHGQYRPIVVDRRTNQILAGNHTWRAAKSLGWSQIAVGFIESKDDDDATRILLADNRATDLASYDDTGLAELLKELITSDEGLLGTLYDAQELDTLILDNKQDEQGNFLSFDEKYEVIIECKSENEQSELLQRLYDEGLKVRALTI